MGLFDWWRRVQERRRSSIFRFWDGVRSRSIDPWAAFRESCSIDGFSWEVTIPLLLSDTIPGDSGDMKMRAKLIEVAAQAARRIFSLPAFEDGGLTEGECLRLLLDFEAYVFGVKKNGSAQPISPPSVEPTPEVTRGDSESGSTAIESEHFTPSGPPRGQIGGSSEK